MTQDLSHIATWRELNRQPQIWRSWGNRLDVEGIRAWIAEQSFDEVWFCGAGTSAYIGDIIAAELKGTRSVPSTDLVQRPAHYLSGARPLVVNFGRSGNSSESVGTLEALAALAPIAPQLNITCNSESALATAQTTSPRKTIILPEETHDTGFAMTSSFSTMLLTALALFDEPCDVADQFARLADQLEDLLPGFGGAKMPGRVVYVGAGPLTFAAREAALKVTELSAGKIPAIWDSTLGFRHGPKSFVDDDTAITIFTSPDAPANDYDADLASELRQQFPNAQVETIGPGGDIEVLMPFGAHWAAALCVAASQVRSVEWSAQLGLNVDDPFAGQNTLSRVVSGVKLYAVAS